MTDVGFTGGGAGNGMVYWAGKQDHRIENTKMIDHIVELVEQKALELNSEEKVQSLYKSVFIKVDYNLFQDTQLR